MTAQALKHRILNSMPKDSVVIDCITALLFSAAISNVLLSWYIFSISFSFGTILGVTALSIVIYAVMRIRWWVCPLLLILGVGAFLLYLQLNEILLERMSMLREFGTWFFSGAAENEAFSQSLEMLVTMHILLCIVALIMFLLMRRFLSVWIPIIIFIAAIYFAQALGTASLVISLSLFMADLVVVLPKAFCRSAKKRNKAGDNVAVLSQAIAIPLAAGIVLLAMIIAPPSGTYTRWRPLANAIHDLGYFINPIQHGQTSNFDIQALGFGHFPDRLGGPVQLSDGYILTVVASQPVLISGSVLDYYTGYRWLSGDADSSLRFNSFLWQDTRNNAFDLNMPLGGSVVWGIFYELTNEVTLEITYANEYFNTVFSNAGMRNVTFSTPYLNDEIFFNARSELYITGPVPIGEVVTIRTRVFNKNAPFFERNFLWMEELVYEDPRFEAIHERFTTLPENLPDSVRETAESIVGDETSPFLKATALAQWLGENFSYTLDTVIPPEEVDFVAHFLETGEGYCVYFATAMAVMARTVGLPSRYVTGFGLVRDFEQENIFYATGRTAHAWAEIYFYGIGWIPFDPLLWNADAPLNMPINEMSGIGEFGEAGHVDYWAQIMAMWEAGLSEEETEAIYEQVFDIREYVIVIAIILVLGAALITAILWVSKKRRYSLQHVAGKIPDLTGRFNFYYKDIMLQLQALGMGVKPAETLLKYSERIGGQIEQQGIQKHDFDAIALVQTRLHFAGIPPDIDEVEVAGKFNSMLEEKLREKLSPISYLRNRVLLK